MFARSLSFLIVLLAFASADESQTDFFTNLCKSKKFGDTNAELPESDYDKADSWHQKEIYPGIKWPLVSEDRLVPEVEVKAKPCEALKYSLSFGVFSMKYMKKCGHYVYKVTSSPNKGQANSVVYWRTMSDESDPAYYVAVFCKRGKVLGKYAEIAESLSDEDIHDLETIYGIHVDSDAIDKCLEDAGACS